MSQPGWGNRVREFLRSYWTPAGRRAFWNLSGLVVCTGISQACAFGVLLILTHGLSQEAFGAVIFALSLQAYLFTVGTFGLTTIVVRDLTLHPDESDETISAFLSVVAAASAAVGLLTAVAVALVPLSWDERVMLWCVAAGNVFACLNLNPLFDAAHRQALAAALMVPGDVLAVALIGGLSFTESLTVPPVGFIMLGKWTLVAALQAAVLGRTVRRWRWVASPGRAGRLIRSGWPILVASLLYMVPLQGGVIAIRAVQGERAAAIYGLAVQVSIVYLTIALLLSRIVQPHICGPYGLHRGFVWKLVSACGLVFGGLWAAGVGAAWVLTRYALPPDYREAFVPISLLLTASLLGSTTLIANSYLTRFGQEHLLVWGYVVAAVAFLFIVLLLTPTTIDQFCTTAVAAIALLSIGSVGSAAFSSRALRVSGR